MEIKITCEGQKYIDISELEYFQGNLKELSDEAFNKLKNLILKYGFSFPVFVWKDHNEIVDGHQRVFVVKNLLSEGYTIGKIPVVEIKAKNRTELAEKLLALNSKFGEMTDDGLYEFLNSYDVNLEDIAEDIDIPDIDINEFMENYYEDDEANNVDEKADEIPEVDEENIVIKKGDLIEIGEHRLLCGDSTKKRMLKN